MLRRVALLCVCCRSFVRQRCWRALAVFGVVCVPERGCGCLAPGLVPWLWPAGSLSGVPRGPTLMRRASSGPVALSEPVGSPVAVVTSPTRGSLPWIYWAAAQGTWRRPRTGLMVPAAGPRRGWGAGLAPRCTCSGPRDGVVPGGSLRRGSWAACAAVVLRVFTRSLTRPVSCTVRLSTRESPGAPLLFCVDADTSPCRLEESAYTSEQAPTGQGPGTYKTLDPHTGEQTPRSH